MNRSYQSRLFVLVCFVDISAHFINQVSHNVEMAIVNSVNQRAQTLLLHAEHVVCGHVLRYAAQLLEVPKGNQVKNVSNLNCLWVEYKSFNSILFHILHY